MKIDLVYLWVDGTEPKWREKKNRYLPKDEQLEVGIAGDCRYVQRDELKYSLRSVEQFAPWINHIYIVTDGQVPKWLETQNTKVTIVDHAEIMPVEALPIFNSSVLELFLYKIKGLSEHFLYANDDFYFGREVAPAFFFHEDGEPIIRVASHSTKGRKGHYQIMLRRMQSLVEATYRRRPHQNAPHHNIDAYRKSDYEATMIEHQKEVQKTLESRFRRDTDFHRSIVNYRHMTLSKHKPIVIGRYNGAKGAWERARRMVCRNFAADSRCFQIQNPNVEQEYQFYNPALFCINDHEVATQSDYERIENFLKKLFPGKSKFER